MNEKRDYYYYYKILGLQPGATPEEVKVAYRKLVNFYHPDRCQSPDTEMMYREIYTAYKALLEQPLTGRTSSEPSVNRNTSERNSNYTEKSRQSTADNSDSSEQTTWTSEDWNDWARRANWASEDWVKEYYDSGERLPFKLKNLPLIFCRSLYEISIWNFISALISALLSCGVTTFGSMLPYSELAAQFYIISWIFLIFSRYYLVTPAWSFLLRTGACILYGAMLAFLIACFYTVSIGNLVWTCICAAFSAWLLLSKKI